MSYAVLIAGLGIIGFLLAYLFFKFEDKQHELLRLLLLGCLFGVFVLVGKVGLDSNNDCELVVNSTYEVNTTLFFDYKTVCHSVSESNTGLTFYKLTMWIVRLISGYLLIYLFYYIFKWFSRIISGKRGRSKDD